MKKFTASFIIMAFLAILLPKSAFAAGVSLSSGGAKYAGDEFYVTVTASGTTFNAFSGTISQSGSLKIIGCTAGDALWVNKPTGTGSFAGALTTATSSFKIATLKVRANSTGAGSISVGGVQLANKGPIVGTGGDTVSLTIQRRPTPPGTITVTSSTHPDVNTAYEATTVTLSWDKPAGVTGFSYLLDQVADTTPAASVSSDGTTATYENQAVGVYYFHIRAINGDGWGSTTHFKLTIKEPDPRISDVLAKPSNITVTRADGAINDPLLGTFSGISIKGVTEPNYMANIKLDPMPTLPEGRIFSVKADSLGNFEYLIDFPIKAGFYKLIVQGQDNKTLTPDSDPILFEIALAKGGSINLLSAADENLPVIPKLKWYEKVNYKINLAIYGLAALLFVSLITITLIIIIKKKSFKKLAKSIRID